MKRGQRTYATAARQNYAACSEENELYAFPFHPVAPPAKNPVRHEIDDPYDPQTWNKLVNEIFPREPQDRETHIVFYKNDVSKWEETYIYSKSDTGWYVTTTYIDYTDGVRKGISGNRYHRLPFPENLPGDLEGTRHTIEGDISFSAMEKKLPDVPSDKEKHHFLYSKYYNIELLYTYTYSEKDRTWYITSSFVKDKRREKFSEDGTYKLPSPESDGGFAIYVAFPKDTAAIGKNDHSKLAELIRKYGLENKQWKVGHAGVIIGNRKDKKTYYADFGRFNPNNTGVGITRYLRDDLATIDATFDENGMVNNAADIIRSLVSTKTNYFAEHKKGGLVVFAVINNLNFEKMKQFVEGITEAPFGFGPYQTYCAKFAQQTLLAGGADMKYYDIEKLRDAAADIVEKNPLKGIFKAMEMLDEAPTGENIVDDIDNQYHQGKGKIKF